jgi:Arc/MetJ-type ribon-helix-helix transcriptional regulator
MTTEHVSIRLPVLLVRRVDEWAEAHAIPDRSTALRALVANGLDAAGIHDAVRRAVAELGPALAREVAQTVLVAAGRSPADAAAILDRVTSRGEESP